jgi:ribulose-5-phosphate 4-epimerase/fuculose-1-phosphate aldolase
VDAKSRMMYRERFTHGEIYKARTDVTAVVHDDSPAVIPFDVSGTSLRPVFHIAAFVAESIPVFGIRDTLGITNLLLENPAAGHALAEILGRKPATLMRGHGVAVTGTSYRQLLAEASIWK